jgi:primosomal protein N' (replication factor Y) (superfamily II helicase)
MYGVKCADQTNLETKGSGTQQVEEEVQELFPEARLLRMDRDTHPASTGASNDL